MGFINSIFNFLLGQAEKANEQYNKGYDRASNLTDEQLERKLKNSDNSTFEMAGLAKAYKERKENQK